jgi:hypothetical protein
MRTRDAIAVAQKRCLRPRYFMGVMQFCGFRQAKAPCIVAGLCPIPNPT